MKRLIFILSLLIAIQISAQTEIVIGDINSNQTSQELPLNMYYNYSYSQVIYNRSELVAGEISSISYYFTGESFSSGTITIYMKEVSDSILSEFSSSDNFVQVYSGPLHLTNGWTTFNFPEIFEYSGQNNLMVAVIKSDNQYYSGRRFKVSVSNSSSIVRYSDTQAYNLSSTHGSGSSQTVRPVTKFGLFPSEDYCYPPNDLSVYVSSPYAATISWEVGDESSSTFTLAYKTDLDDDWTIADDGIQDTSYTLTSLLPYTKYHIKLWAVCPGSNSFQRETYFITQPDESCFISLTYDEDFDNFDDGNKWRYTHYGENKWHVGPAVNNTRNLDGDFTQGNALYISNDGGLTNSYDNTSTSVSHFSTLLTLLDSVHYGISFDYKIVGQGYYDNLTVSLAPLYTELNTNNSNFIEIATINNSYNTWRRFEAVFPQNLVEGDYQLIFTWKNNNYSGENPPAAIDNLRVQASLCAVPANFAATLADVDGNASMTVNITDNVNQAASYIVEYRLAGESIWDTIQEANPVMVPYLPYSSTIEYRVVANCATSGVSMPSIIKKISTPCGITENFPYKEYFESNVFINTSSGNTPNCWKTINGGEEYSQWNYSPQNGINGSGNLCLQILGYGDELVVDEWIISPTFALNGNQRLNFQYKLMYQNQGMPKPKIDIYLYNTDIVDYSSPQDTVYCEYVTTIYDSNLTATKWKMAEILLNDYVGNYRIAIVVRELCDNFSIDNFVVSDIPDCFEVYGLEVKAYSGTSVSVNYETDNISGSGVAIAYAEEILNQHFYPEGADMEIISGDEELPYILEGLEPGKTYIFAASQTCGGEWSDTVKATLPRVYSVPFEFDLDTEVSTPEMNFTTTNNYNNWFLGEIYNSSFETDSLPGRALYVTSDNGTSASYIPGDNNNCYAYLNVEFNSGAEYELFFDWICEGNANRDYLKVYLVPFGQSISEEYAITEELNLSSQWQRKQVILPANRYNGGYQLIFGFHTYGYLSEYRLPAIIDNIRIDVNECARIVDLDLSVTDTETGPNVVVGLLDEFNTSASYVLRYKESNESTFTEITGLTRDSFPYTLSNQIDYQSIYQLQIGVICEQGVEPYFNEEIFSIMTPCIVLQTPWEMDFEENILEPQYCWQLYNGFPSIYDTTYTADLLPNSSWSVEEVTLNGINSNRLNVNLRGLETKDWVVTPTINLGDGSTVKQLVFDLALRASNQDVSNQCGNDDRFIVMLSTDNGESWDIHNAIVFKNNDEDTLHNLSSITNQALPFSWKLLDENNQALSGLVKIAFYVESTIANTDNILCIDNLSIEDWNECQTPHNPYVLAENISSSSAIVDFTTIDDNVEYFEYVVVAGECDNFDTLQTMTSSEISIELQNLEDETFYTFAVRSICGENMASSWISTTFTTLVEPKQIPFVTTFSDNVSWYYSTNGVNANSWSIGSATSADSNGMAAYLSTDEGISYDAEITQNSTIAYLWQDLSFGETENNFELSFDWKCTGRVWASQVYGAINVYLVDIAPLSIDELPSNPIITLHSSEQWQSERIYLGNIIGDKRLVFATYGYTTENEALTPAAIDNVGIIVSPCSLIEELSVLNIGTNSMDLVWEETGADSYVVYYRDEYSSEYLTMTTTNNFATLSNLGASTRYFIKVKGVCGESESIISEEISQITLSEIATLPYSCDFESPGANGWVIKNGNCANKWWVGDINHNSNKALFVTGDNGLTNNINFSNQSVVIAEKHFQLGQSDSIRISFDVKLPENNNNNYLKVFFVPENVEFESSSFAYGFSTIDYSDGVLISNSQSENSYIINNIINTQNMSITIPTPYNEIRKLVFVWVNNYNNVSAQGAIIDNVIVEEIGDIITCTKPVGNSIIANNVLQTTATISWQDNDPTHNAWNVYYKSENETNYNFVTVTNQTSLTLTELSLYTFYYVYVRTNCGDEESYSTDTIRFQTHCEGVEEFPYFVGFEDQDLSCWVIEGNRGNDWKTLSLAESNAQIPIAYEGNQILCFEAEDGNNSIVASPIFNLSELEQPYVKFRYYISLNADYGEGFSLYYRENQSSEWINLKNYTTATMDWILDSLSLPNPTSSYQIAFKVLGDYPLAVSLDALSVYDLGSIGDGALSDVENANELQATIFPNPANNQAILKVEGLSQDAKILICDMQGRIVGKGEMKCNEKEYKLELEKFASGVYYVKIITEKAFSTQKLIVE
jgi:hypothetical protein